MSVLWSARENLDPDAVRSIERWVEKNQKPEDKVLSEYQELRGNLIDKAELPRDWDKIEKQLSQFLSRHPQGIQDYIMEMRDAWIQDLPEPARTVELDRLKAIEDGTWWDNYRTPSKHGRVPKFQQEKPSQPKTEEKRIPKFQQ